MSDWYFITQDDRLVFKVCAEAGELVAAPRKDDAQKRMACAFASGESLDAKREALVFDAAEKSKTWDSFVFKLKMEGMVLKAGTTLKLPFGKL